VLSGLICAHHSLHIKSSPNKYFRDIGANITSALVFSLYHYDGTLGCCFISIFFFNFLYVMNSLLAASLNICSPVLLGVAKTIQIFVTLV
jgi:hypothetical protein